MAGAFECDLCWHTFLTQQELDTHIAMENEVEWTLDVEVDA